MDYRFGNLDDYLMTPWGLPGKSTGKIRMAVL